MKIRDCSYCGDSHRFRECPAFGKMCATYKRKKKHFSKVCRSRNGGFQLSKIHEVVAEEDSEENDYAFLIDVVGNPIIAFCLLMLN